MYSILLIILNLVLSKNYVYYPNNFSQYVHFVNQNHSFSQI